MQYAILKLSELLNKRKSIGGNEMKRIMRTGLALLLGVAMVLSFAVLPQNQAHAGLNKDTCTFSDRSPTQIYAAPG